MSAENTLTDGNGAGTADAAEERHFLLQQLYAKDVSFESPSTPEIFSRGGVEPETELNIKSSHRQIGEEIYEVVLHLDIHAKHEDQSIFLVELDQAGIFTIKGYPENEIQALLGSYCPATLFPYAREAIASLVGKGGFPPLLLQPINFDALYSRTVKDEQGS